MTIYPIEPAGQQWRQLLAPWVAFSSQIRAISASVLYTSRAERLSTCRFNREIVRRLSFLPSTLGVLVRTCEIVVILTAISLNYGNGCAAGAHYKC